MSSMNLSTNLGLYFYYFMILGKRDLEEKLGLIELY